MDILMPQLGETVEEGKITGWLKAVGDTVAAGEALFEIETDKSSMEVPTTAAGILVEIRVPLGDTVPVGTIVAVVAAPAAPAAPAALQAAVREAPARDSPTRNALAPEIGADPFRSVRTPTTNFGTAVRADGVQVTPLARRLAAEGGVDVNDVMGSGPAGRIVGRDVAALAVGGRATVSATKATRSRELLAEEVKALYTDVPYQEVEIDGMRRAVARRLLESTQTIPHFYLSLDVLTDELATVRTDANRMAGGAFKLSVNDFIIKALAMALQRVPEANVVWAADRLLKFSRSDVGVAVAVDGGLYTPVVRGADRKSLSAISVEMKALADRARKRLLKAQDYSGGSISVSNLGMFGVRAFSAIINPPQSAILAVGALERRPVERPGGLVGFGEFLSVTLSCDHRVIDGALGAQLLRAFKELMESPRQLFA